MRRELQLQFVGSHGDGRAADVLGLEERPCVGRVQVGAPRVLGGVGAAHIANGQHDGKQADVDADPFVDVVLGVGQPLDGIVNGHGNAPVCASGRRPKVCRTN